MKTIHTHYLITKHFHQLGIALFGRIVDEHDQIPPEHSLTTCFVLEKDRHVINHHYKTFGQGLPLVDQSDIIQSRK